MFHQMVSRVTSAQETLVHIGFLEIHFTALDWKHIFDWNHSRKSLLLVIDLITDYLEQMFISKLMKENSFLICDGKISDPPLYVDFFNRDGITILAFLNMELHKYFQIFSLKVKVVDKTTLLNSVLRILNSFIYV